MTDKSTPGPWKQHGARPTEVWSPCGSILIANCAAEPRDSEHREQALPNARLTAAAPTLADALEAALHEAGHACCCEKPHSSAGVSLHEADCWTAVARAALRAAGRLP